MDENMMPELTLDPSGAAAAQAAAQAAEAAIPKAPDTPALTLEGAVTPEDAAAVQAARDAQAIQLDESQLNEAERKMVNDFAQKIDITDSTQVLQYGAAAQKNIAGFSENALKHLGGVGEIGRAHV